MSIVAEAKSTTETRDTKEFRKLKFYLWRVRNEHRGEWRKEVFLMGDSHALETLVESLQGLLEGDHRHGGGMRRYRCNPPRNFDHVAYGRKNGIRIDWPQSLVVRFVPDAPDDEMHRLEGDTVTLRVNPVTLNRVIAGARNQLDITRRYGYCSPAAGGLWFSTDWRGI